MISTTSTLDRVPDVLTERVQWVCWKRFNRDDKIVKMPVRCDGTPASSTDAATWTTFSECCESAHNFAGVGFVFSESDPFIGIDLDGCRNPETGIIDDWAKEIIAKIGTYAEVSPSLTGVKLWGVSELPWSGINKKAIEGLSQGGKQAAIEIYEQGRYFAVTGKRIKGFSEVVNVDDALAWLKDLHGMNRSQVYIPTNNVSLSTPILERAAKYVGTMPPAISGSSGHNAAFKVACVLVKGFGLSDGDAFDLFMREYNPRCNPVWTEREVMHKINSAKRQPGASGYLAEAEPNDWNRITIPSQYKEHKPTKEEQQKEVAETRKTTLKKATLGYIESIKGGKPNLLSTGVPDLDYAVGGGVGGGEMVIIAARPSHGKSAVALQMVHHVTSLGIPVGIISEEMSALALGKRTVQFVSETPEEDWGSMNDFVQREIEKHFEGRADAYIVESCGTVVRAIAEAERMQTEHGIKALFVDYAQILNGTGRGRYEQVTDVSQSLRQLASRTGLTVFVLAQLSREIEKREKFVPTMRDLKETGQLEQDADVIVFGVWPYKLDATIDKKEYQFYIAKNRNREIRKAAFSVVFEPRRQAFRHVEMETLPEFDQFNGQF